MKISRVGNQHSELLDKVAQLLPEESASTPSGKPANDPFADKAFLEDKWHGKQDNNLNETDIIGALTHAMQHVKNKDWKMVLRAIDEVKDMISELNIWQIDNDYPEDKPNSPDLMDTHPMGEYMSKGPGEY